MKPYDTFRSTVFFVTTILVFFIWNYINLVFKDNVIFGISLSGLVSLGAYRFVLIIAETLLGKSRFVKKLIFDNIYFEGIWVGCYLDHQNSLKYFVEYFEQDFDRLVIRGINYHSDRSFKGTWVSDNVMIFPENGKIVYTYMTDMINNSHKNQGLSEFHIIRDNHRDAPCKLIGFSSDLYSGKKTVSVEYRYPKGNSKDEKDLLDFAAQIYNSNVELFRKNAGVHSSTFE